MIRTFGEPYRPGGRPDWEMSAQLEAEEQSGECPRSGSSPLIHYFLLCLFICMSCFLFRKVLQLQEIKACISMKDLLYQSLENDFLF